MSDLKSTTLEKLPAEILLHVITFLQPEELTPLQRVSRGFHKLARDDEVWRFACFLRSRRKQTIIHSPPRASQRGDANDQHRLRNLRRALHSSSPITDASEPKAERGDSESEHRRRDVERARKLANWDPTYPGERFDWYTEYIARNAPTSLSWLQQPSLPAAKSGDSHADICGLGFHVDSQSCRAVAPLENGSVAIWDLRHATDLLGTSTRRGAVAAQSKPGLVAPARQSGATTLAHRGRIREALSNVNTECVSIDHVRNKVYVAVGNALNEVDLETMQVSTFVEFRSAITALSKVDHPLPLTVGTRIGIHIYDPRTPMGDGCATLESRADPQHPAPYQGSLRHPTSRLHLMMDHNHALHDISRQTTAHQDGGPLSILHLPFHSTLDSSTDIYAAGRFPSILVYDRRLFPKIRATHHSGASLCGLAALPYPHRSADADAMARSQLSIAEVHAAKAHAGNTLVACGEYGSKGSLELYSLPADAGGQPPAVFKNRVDAASSKLLSVATHGARILVADGGGELRWLERDGHTLVRKLPVKHHVPDDFGASTGIFNTSRAMDTDEVFGDIARKVLPTNENVRTGRVESDEVLVWTGQKIGVLGFSAGERFGAGGWEEEERSAEERAREREEGEYARGMRRTLGLQADEVRWVRGLGMGIGGGLEG